MFILTNLKTKNMYKVVILWGGGYLDASVCGVSHGLQQSVILWVKGDGEGTVYYSS